jgi:hypothetical protein
VTITERPSAPSVAFSTGKPGAYVQRSIHPVTFSALACAAPRPNLGRKGSEQAVTL